MRVAQVVLVQERDKLENLNSQAKVDLSVLKGLEIRIKSSSDIKPLKSKDKTKKKKKKKKSGRYNIGTRKGTGIVHEEYE